MVQFQKIYVLSLPDRRDKRDAVALSAYLTGLEIEFVDGVTGSQISNRSRPDVRPLKSQPIRILMRQYRIGKPFLIQMEQKMWRVQWVAGEDI